MATVYSLVCFGGLSGKTITFTDAGDIVNLTNHGLRQGVTGIVFSTTGSLPTGITAGQTYYPRDGADANKFTIYPTKADALAGTNQVTFTGTGSGTHTVKSAYMLGLSALELARYGESGSERIYNGLVAWNTARASVTDRSTNEVCEIGEIFTDIATAQLQISMSAASVLITTKVDGEWSDAFHNGVPGSGYIFYRNVGGDQLLYLTSFYAVVDGVELFINRTSANAVLLSEIGTGLRRCIIHQTSASGTSQRLVYMTGPITFVENCLLYDCYNGILISDFGGTRGAMVANNIVTMCTGTGISPVGSGALAFVYNNISYGNAENWGTQPTALHGALNNYGISTDTPWDTGTSTAIKTITSESFVDSANIDYRPASASSPQVDTGIVVYGLDNYDLAGDIRPNYDPSGPMEWDGGCYEYDHGNGLAPETTTLTISANVSLSGAEVRIYDLDTSDGTFGTELSGVESHTSSTYIYEGLRGNQIAIQIMQSGYEEHLQTLTLENAIQSLGITLRADLNA